MPPDVAVDEIMQAIRRFIACAAQADTVWGDVVAQK
jgi:hypothetical protein